MSRYLDYTTFITSPYGIDFMACENGIFASSGEVQLFLDDMSGLIDLYAGQTFGTGVVIEHFTAKSGLSNIFLRKFPLNSISSIVYYLPGEISPNTLPATSYKFFPDGKVWFIEYLHPQARYEITYNAGYTTVPSQIELATMILANSYALAIENNGVATPDGGNTTRFVFGSYEENFVDPRQRYDDLNVGVPVTVMAILNRFKYLK